MQTRRRSILQQRFWSKVAIRVGDCWPWLAVTDKDGYGMIKVKASENPRKHKGNVRAHALAYQLTRSGFPVEGIQVLHRCDNPPCCNPDHLFLGTNEENTQDRHAKGRSAKGEGHGNAQFTWQIVRNIRADYSAGRGSLREVGQRYGVSKSQTARIVRGQGWREP